MPQKSHVLFSKSQEKQSTYPVLSDTQHPENYGNSIMTPIQKNTY